MSNIYTGINSTTENEFYIGDKTDGYKYIYANNSDIAKPGLRWNDDDDQWEYSNDGVIWEIMGSGGTSEIDYIICGLEGTLPASIDGYFLGDSSITDNEDMVSYIINKDYATLQNLYVTCSAKPTQDVIITIRKNKEDTNMTVTLDASSVALNDKFYEADLVNTEDVVAGDYIGVRVESGGGTLPDDVQVSSELIVRAADPQPPATSLTWWHEGDSVTMSGADVTHLIDKSPNGHNVTFLANTTFSAAGGPNGTPMWGPIDTAGNGITSPPLINANETHYFVVENMAPASRVMLQSNSGTTQILLGENFRPLETFIYNSGVKAVVTATGGWQLLRIRWNNTTPVNAIKYTGQAEATHPGILNLPVRTWVSFGWSVSNFALHLNYAEDTLATGRDAEVQAYLLTKFNLVL